MGFFDDEDVGKLILRVMLAVLMLFHGVGKILNFSGTVGWLGGMLASHGLPGFIAYGVFIGEIIGPLMILFGFYARWGSLFIIINMLFAIGLVHMGNLVALTDGGTLQLQADYFFLFSALALCFLGSGRYALRRDY